jgi:hypothetical protein
LKEGSMTATQTPSSFAAGLQDPFATLGLAWCDGDLPDATRNSIHAWQRHGVEVCINVLEHHKLLDPDLTRQVLGALMTCAGAVGEGSICMVLPETADFIRRQLGQDLYDKVSRRFTVAEGTRTQ